MPISLIAKGQNERDASARIIKFMDRIHLQSNGSADGMLEFIIQNQKESCLNISTLSIIKPLMIGDTLRDVSESFTDLSYHYNQRYTKPVMLLDAAKNLYSIDGIPATVGNPANFTPVANEDTHSIIRMNFDPIPPSSSRAFRIGYEIPRFAKMYGSIGNFTYYFNHIHSDVAATDVVEGYVPVAIEIDKSLCEVCFLLPHDYIFNYSRPNPTAIRAHQRFTLFSNERLPTERTEIYYDIEDPQFNLPGRSLPRYLRPDPQEGVGIYCDFKKPEVSQEAFSTDMGRLEKAMSLVDGEVTKARNLIGELRTSLSTAKTRIDQMVQHSRTAFYWSMGVALLALVVSIIGLFV